MSIKFVASLGVSLLGTGGFAYWLFFYADEKAFAIAIWIILGALLLKALGAPWQLCCLVAVVAVIPFVIGVCDTVDDKENQQVENISLLQPQFEPIPSFYLNMEPLKICHTP